MPLSVFSKNPGMDQRGRGPLAGADQPSNWVRSATARRTTYFGGGMSRLQGERISSLEIPAYSIKST